MTATTPMPRLPAGVVGFVTLLAIGWTGLLLPSLVRQVEATFEQTDAGMGYVLRLVDKDNNGQADEYTVFATLDSPRGAAFDGDTLYVSHPPFVTALRDKDGDGIGCEPEDRT